MSRGLRNRTAVVTGASSGIGAATARRLVAEGFEVVAAARRADRLRSLADETGCRAVTLDVSDASSVNALAEAMEGCSVLVNNAGGAFGLDPVASASDDDWQRMYDVNVLGTMRMTRALLPLLVASGDGIVVNVTSTAGHVAYEGGAGYCAAKSAERAMTEALRLELCGQPVRVTEIAPGMVQTDEFSLVRFEGDADRANAVYAGVPGPLVADDIADCIAWVVTRPEHVNIDSMIVRPRAQAAQHKVHREPVA
jgi:NADP-dependent 3-hydroxy acid dehydrogenase YdfG